MEAEDVRRGLNVERAIVKIRLTANPKVEVRLEVSTTDILDEFAHRHPRQMDLVHVLANC
jgi:hypothetical protein